MKAFPFAPLRVAGMSAFPGDIFSCEEVLLFNSKVHRGSFQKRDGGRVAARLIRTSCEIATLKGGGACHRRDERDQTQQLIKWGQKCTLSDELSAEAFMV